MPQTNSYDALVVGAGPNGLSAGIAIAQTGRSVLVVEGRDTVGGGARSAALTLPWIPPRRMLGGPPAGNWLAILLHVAAIRARFRLGAASRAASISTNR